MRPIIFVRIASMLYYQGITDKDSPVNGGSYVKETGTLLRRSWKMAGRFALAMHSLRAVQTLRSRNFTSKR